MTTPEYITDLPTDQKVELDGATGYCSIVFDFTKARFYKDIEEVFKLYNKQPEWFKAKYSVYYTERNSFGHLVYIKTICGVTDGQIKSNKQY